MIHKFLNLYEAQKKQTVVSFLLILQNLGSLHSSLNISYYRGNEPVIHAMYRDGDVCPFNSGARKYQTDLFIQCGKELVSGSRHTSFKFMRPYCTKQIYNHFLTFCLFRAPLCYQSMKTVAKAIVRGVWLLTPPLPAPLPGMTMVRPSLPTTPAAIGPPLLGPMCCLPLPRAAVK